MSGTDADISWNLTTNSVWRNILCAGDTRQDVARHHSSPHITMCFTLSSRKNSLTLILMSALQSPLEKNTRGSRNNTKTVTFKQPRLEAISSSLLSESCQHVLSNCQEEAVRDLPRLVSNAHRKVLKPLCLSRSDLTHSRSGANHTETTLSNDPRASAKRQQV